MVEHVLAKDEIGVRFSLAAPKEKQPEQAVFLCDTYLINPQKEWITLCIGG